MEIDQSLIYIIILIFTALILSLIVLFLSFVKILKSYLEIKEGKDKYIDPKILLLRAHAKSQKIIEDATDKAGQIITSSEAIKYGKVDNIQKLLEEVNAQYLKIYQQSINEIREESIKTLQNVPEYIKTLLSKETLEIKDELTQEIKKSQGLALQKISEAYKKVDEEVSTYRKMRLDALDNTIINIIQRVSRKVLSREISTEEHEKLVLKALEEAKKQNVFLSTDSVNEEQTNSHSDK